jgi:multidrug efflux pump subunit AcrA (membrane-fusion protein)
MSRLRHLARQPWFVMPVLAVLVLGGWFVVHRGGGSNAAAGDANERLVTATEGTIGDTVSTQGTLAAADTSDLSFASAGTVTAVNVVAGQTVKKGQVLATIDPTDLIADQAAVDAAAADLASARQAVAQATS